MLNLPNQLLAISNALHPTVIAIHTYAHIYSHIYRHLSIQVSLTWNGCQMR